MKLTVVGGGSTYTPELVDGFARLRDELPVDELVLVDPSEHRLELVGGVARRILRHLGHPARLTTTTEPRRRAVADADVVLLQLRVGGQASSPGRRDLAAGVRLRRPGDDRRGRPGQGAAHGPGRARHRRAIRRASPDAWIVDFTNPVGIVTRALLQAGHRAIGLCNVAIGFQRRFAALLASSPSASASTTSGSTT